METFKKLILESLQDNATGRFSHSRIIAMIVAIAATAFMWKLILMGGMTIEYFLAYMAYGTGHQTLNKFLDSRDKRYDAADELKDQPVKAKVVAPAPAPHIDDLPKPPKTNI